jgi:hypothetical protein
VGRAEAADPRAAAVGNERRALIAAFDARTPTVLAQERLSEAEAAALCELRVQDRLLASASPAAFFDELAATLARVGPRPGLALEPLVARLRVLGCRRSSSRFRTACGPGGRCRRPCARTSR